MNKVQYVAMFLLCLGVEIALTGPVVYAGLTRHRREASNVDDWKEDVKDYANDVWESMWGGNCATNDQCTDVISYCYKDGDLDLRGECRLTWWFLLVLAVVVVLLIASVLSCICSPCCCLYNACRGLCDCLCCCCCKNDGYSPANRS